MYKYKKKEKAPQWGKLKRSNYRTLRRYIWMIKVGDEYKCFQFASRDRAGSQKNVADCFQEVKECLGYFPDIELTETDIFADTPIKREQKLTESPDKYEFINCIPEDLEDEIQENEEQEQLDLQARMAGFDNVEDFLKYKEESK